MNKLADLIEEHAEELHRLETVAMGALPALRSITLKITADSWRCRWLPFVDYKPCVGTER